MSISLSISVDNFEIKNNKKDLTNHNQRGLIIFSFPPKKLAIYFYCRLNTVFIIIYGKKSSEFINFAGCLHPVNKVLYQLSLSH